MTNAPRFKFLRRPGEARRAGSPRDAAAQSGRVDRPPRPQAATNGPVTAVLTVLSMGFSGYGELPRYPHELAIAPATSLDILRTGRARALDLQARLRDSVEQDARILQRLHNSLEVERIVALAGLFLPLPVVPGIQTSDIFGIARRPSKEGVE